MTDPPSLSHLQRLQLERMRSVLANPGFIQSIERAAEAQRYYERWATRGLEVVRDAWERTVRRLAAVPWEQMLELFLEYQRVMPSNIRGRLAIEAFMDDRPNTTMALAWVVPTDLVVELLARRDEPKAQMEVALEHQNEILTQCELVLSGLDAPAADRMREAIACLRAGFDGPAQSHAANVFDSVVNAVFAESHPRKQRQVAVEIGSSPLPAGDEVAVRALVDRVVLGPAVSAFAEWFPERQGPVPLGFARHATAHAAHIDGVFAPDHALLAIMLAASLVVHYRAELSPHGSFNPNEIPGLISGAGAEPSEAGPGESALGQ